MAVVALYDACVLYPVPQRDLLVRVAIRGLVHARWTDRILDECFDNLAAQRPDLPPARLQRTRELMNRAVRDCLVTGYEPLIESVALPDPDDFLQGLADGEPEAPLEVIVEQAAALRSPPQTVEDLLDTLRNNGLARTVARMRAARGI